MRKYTFKIITALVIVIVLTTAFWVGGNAPNLKGFETDTIRLHSTSQNKSAVKGSGSETNEDSPLLEIDEEDTSAEQEFVTESELSTDDITDEPIDNNETLQALPSDEKSDGLFCTIMVSCRVLLGNPSYLPASKASLVPPDGIILNEKTVKYNDGESAFNVLQRELKREKIHLEFSSTPIYNSSYIEGINNIYEFDCGEGSGWMYKVNDLFPPYASSRYIIKSGDRIEFLYTCDLGKDIGGEYASDGQKQ